MKKLPHYLTLTALSISCALAFTSCDSGGDKRADSKPGSSDSKSSAKPEAKAVPTEKEAIATVKTELEEIAAIMKKGDEGANTGDMFAIFPAMRAMLKKMTTLSTAGAPADLKEAIEKVSAMSKKMSDLVLPVFSDIPEDEAGIKAWQEKIKGDEAAGKKVFEKMMSVDEPMKALTKEQKALAEEVKPVFKKYELPTEFLDK